MFGEGLDLQIEWQAMDGAVHLVAIPLGFALLCAGAYLGYPRLRRPAVELRGQTAQQEADTKGPEVAHLVVVLIGLVEDGIGFDWLRFERLSLGRLGLDTSVDSVGDIEPAVPSFNRRGMRDQSALLFKGKDQGVHGSVVDLGEFGDAMQRVETAGDCFEHTARLGTVRPAGWRCVVRNGSSLDGRRGARGEVRRGRGVHGVRVFALSVKAVAVFEIKVHRARDLSCVFLKRVQHDSFVMQ